MRQRRFPVLLMLVLTGALGLTGCADYVMRSPIGEFSLGTYQEGLKLSREEAVAAYNYCPTGGCVLRLESLDIRPSQARKGETLTLTTTYTILTPEQEAIPISMSREIYYRGKSLGKTKMMDSRNYNGTWTQRLDISLPANAGPGIYTLVTRVSSGYGSDMKSVEFTVE